MGQKKLIKFAAIKAYENVLEFPQNMQGKWAAFFDAIKKSITPIDITNLVISDQTVLSNTTTPLTIELACGRGEYAVGQKSRLDNRH